MIQQWVSDAIIGSKKKKKRESDCLKRQFVENIFSKFETKSNSFLLFFAAAEKDIFSCIQLNLISWS